MEGCSNSAAFIKWWISFNSWYLFFHSRSLCSIFSIEVLSSLEEIPSMYAHNCCSIFCSWFIQHSLINIFYFFTKVLFHFFFQPGSCPVQSNFHCICFKPEYPAYLFKILLRFIIQSYYLSIIGA